MTDKPSIKLVLESYGFESIPTGDRWYKVKCAFHGERNASASVQPSENRFRCFACGISGDSFDIIQEQEGVSFLEARKLAEQRYGFRYEEVRGSLRGKPGGSVHGKSGARKPRRTFQSGLR